MKTALILVAALAVAVMLMASKCTIGDKSLPHSTPTEQSK